MESDHSRICFCPQCDTHVPFIELIRKRRSNIQITCQCGYKKEIAVKDYLTLLKQNPKKMSFKTNCDEHSKPFLSYCFICKKNLCEDCKDNHNPFVIHFSSFSIEAAKKEFEEKKDTYPDYLKKEVKDVYVSDEETKKMEDILLSENQDLFDLYKIILDNHINNYEMFKLSSKFSLNKCPKWNSSKQEEMAKEYTVIKENPLQVEGKIEPVKSFPGCKGYMKYLLLLQDGRLCTTNSLVPNKGNSINIYNPENDYKCEISINDHKGIVTSLCQLENGILVSSSKDFTLKFWKINKDSYECLHSIPTGCSFSQIIELPGDRLLTSRFTIFETKDPYKYDQPVVITNPIDKSRQEKQILYIDDRDCIIGIATAVKKMDGGLDIVNGTTFDLIKSIRGPCANSYGLFVPINNDRLFMITKNDVQVLNIEESELDKEDPKNEEVNKKKLEKVVEKVIRKKDINTIIELKKEELYLFAGEKDKMYLYNYITDECVSLSANCGKICSAVKVNEKSFYTASENNICLWEFKC